MDAGLIGGIIGGVLGCLGGAVGTYFSIKNTNGPLERAYMIRVSFITWIAIIVFLLLLWLIPKPYNYILWIPYVLALPLSIAKCNKRLSELRQLDAESKFD